MERTNGSLAHRARPLFVVATLITSVALAFTPGVPSVIALSPSPDPSASVAPSLDPGQSIAPDPTPVVAPDPTPSPTLDPAPTASAAPAPDPAQSIAPDPAQSIAPDPAPSVAPDPTPSPTLDPAPTATPAPTASAAPGPTATPTPTPDPTPDPTPLSSGVISRDGGAIDAGYIHLTFPANAVNEPAMIFISPAAGLPEFDGAPPLTGISIMARTVETGDPVPSFGTPVTIRLAIGIPELANAELADLSFAELAPDRTWQPLGTSLIGIALVAAIGAPGTFGVVVNIPARPVAIDVGHSADAPAQGRHRIEPGAALTLTIAARPELSIASARLRESLPAGWTLVDAGGGAWDQQAGIVTWDFGDVRGRRAITRSLVVRAPMTSPTDGAATFPATFSANLTYRGGSQAAADVNVLVAPRLVIEHRTLARVDSETYRTTYLPVDQPLRDHQWYQVFRIRFQARNADSIPVGLTPLLQYRPAGTTAWTTVPAREDQDGVAFYVAPTRFRQVDPRRPNAPGPEVVAIGTDEIKMHDRDDSEERPAPGTQSMGLNPAPTMTIPGRSYTEVEFSVRDTADMQYRTTYEFRVTDGGTALQGAVTAVVQVGPQPPIPFSPGQRQGIWVGGPIEAGSPSSVAYRLSPPDVPTIRRVDASAIAAVESATAPRYALLVVATPATQGATAALAAPLDSTHGPYSPTSDACGACHGAHTAQGANLLKKATPQSTLCFTCHDSAGTGSVWKVQAQYTDATVPANDPATSSYFRHDALATGSGHTLAQLDEFGGVSKRHSECGDCHNSHRATSTASTQTIAGWTNPGQLDGISGVSVVNGAANSAPTYTFLDGTTAPITLEYQLCFKCHSGFTQLLAQQAGKPSWWALDKGVEFNPANLSFHPIEAPGKNATTAMAGSLSGTSPYKLWNFTVGSVIRCVNCHGDSRKAIPGVAAGADLAPHAVPNRGVLMNNYRDRILKSAGEAYAAADFALCFQCHAEAPFLTTPAATDMTLTNFKRHGHKVKYLTGGSGVGTDINTPGAGAGKAICAECHFRIHSTVYMVPQTSTGGRLVNAAPNVQPNGGVLEWTQTANGGTCTLICHGVSHKRSYSY